MQSGGERPLHGFMVSNPINLSFARHRSPSADRDGAGSEAPAVTEVSSTSK